MVKSIGFLLILTATTVFAADVKISQLPLGSGATVGSSDSFPYVQASNLVTKRLTIYDLVNVPNFRATFAPIANPTFTGTLTAPAIVTLGIGTSAATDLAFKINGTTKMTLLTSGDLSVAGAISAVNIHGTNSGDVTLAAVGSSPSANGASLSGQVLTLQPADGTHPGLLTSGSQTIGGAKTFSAAISASNLSGTNTGDQTITLTGDTTGSGTGSFATTLATVNSNVGSFGSSTAIPNFTVNGKGLLTAAGSSAVIAPVGTLTGTTLAANVVSSSLTSVGTISAGTWNGTTVGLGFGGTGQTTSGAALNALLPPQASNSGKVLTTDGSNPSWGTASSGMGFVGSVKFTACSADWSTSSASYAAFTALGSCTIVATGSVTAPGTVIPGFILTNRKVGTYLICVSGQWGNSTSGGDAQFEFNDSTYTSIDEVDLVGQNSVFGAGGACFTLPTTTTGSNIPVQLLARANSGAAFIRGTNRAFSMTVWYSP